MIVNVEEIIRCIKQGDENGVQTQLQEFNKEYAQCFFFDEEEKERKKQRQLDQFRKNKLKNCPESDSDVDEQEDGGLLFRQSLAVVVVRFLRTGVTGRLLRVCLRTLRILSRDKQVLAPLVTDTALLTLAKLAGLITDDNSEEDDPEPDFYDKVLSSLAETSVLRGEVCKGQSEEIEDSDQNEKSTVSSKDEETELDFARCEENVSSFVSYTTGIDEDDSGCLHHTVLKRGRRDRRESRKGQEEEEEAGEDDPGEEMQRKEAMKVLCNVVYNSTRAQERFSKLRLISGLIQGLRTTIDSLSFSSVQFYELRLMFLVTALRPELSTQLQQAGGVSLLTAALERCLEVQWKDQYEGSVDPAAPPISLDASQRIIEILKILFNITHSSHRKEPSEEDAALYRHLVAILRLCLMRKSVLTDDADELQGHTVNLLSALPLQCLDVLLMVPLEPHSEQCEGQRFNMDCVYALLMFMERRLEAGEKIKEKLTPILNLLTESCRAHRETRQYIRKHILPPLRDVTLRPEEGSTVKSRLIRLMTHLDTDVKHCAAELIFVLCKENVRRFVKYTGYGNAAGLLATRGLLGGQGLKSSITDTQYSSESDSDTEEYRQVKDRINPVTGRVEAEIPDPMEGMTEEEKEEEAKRLIMLFNKLSRDNIIQPMGVSAEGKLVPMSGLRGNSLIEESPSESEDEEEEAEEVAKR